MRKENPAPAGKELEGSAEAMIAITRRAWFGQVEPSRPGSAAPPSTRAKAASAAISLPPG